MTDIPAPGKPGTYLPVPGEKMNTDPMNRDADNASAIKEKNTQSSEAATSISKKGFHTKVGGSLYTTAEKEQTDATPAILKPLPVEGGKGEKGDKGEPGARGPAGPAGPAGEVDYDRLRDMIQEMIDAALNLKSLRIVSGTPTSVFGTKTITIRAELFDQIASSASPVTPVWSVSSGVATISSAGVLTATNPATDTPVTVTATYTDGQGKTYTVSHNVTVRALKVSSLAVTGTTNLTLDATVLYVATATYTDGTTKVVTADPGTTWSLTNSAIGVLTANSLKVVATNTVAISSIVRATFVEAGTTVTGQANVTLAAPVVQTPKAVYGVAAAPVTGAAYYTYSQWGNFITTALTQTGSGNGKANTITTNQAAGQFGWYAYPKSLGTATFTDASNNFVGGWDGAKRAFTTDSDLGPETVTVTVNGSPVEYYLYRTTNANLGSKTWNIA